MSFYRDFNDKTAIADWNTIERAPYRAIDVRRLSPALGAEISGVDLSKEISDEQFAEIRRAVDENLAVIFRDQKLSREAQKRFAQRFGGSLHRHELAADKLGAGAQLDPEVLAWRTGPTSRFTAGDGWHPDVSCDPEPIAYSFLHVARNPPLGGDTAFVNSYLSYEALSEPFKLFLEGLTAIHDGNEGWSASYGAQPRAGTTFPASEHPVVATHPRTGRKFLYVNRAFTTHIVQLSRAESDAVLDLLFRQVEKELVFQTRIHWTSDSLLVWDNWATQHHAVWDYYPEERWGDRVSVVLPGQRPRA